MDAGTKPAAHDSLRTAWLGISQEVRLARGGQPVTYVRDSSRQDPYTAALLALARAFQEDSALASALGKKFAGLRDHLDYLTHFNKKIKKAAKRSAPARPKARKAIVAKPAAKREPDLFARSFGGTLHYMEEREWRIVYADSLAEFFETGPGGAGKPEFYLPFEPGRELFTAVLPDNRTVSMAAQEKSIRKYLFPKDAPHVTLLSLQDIGTF